MFCSICLTKINKNDEYIENECCKNTFHNSCLEEWYKIKENCPLCRRNNEIIQEKTKTKLENVNTFITILKLLIPQNN